MGWSLHCRCAAAGARRCGSAAVLLLMPAADCNVIHLPPMHSSSHSARYLLLPLSSSIGSSSYSSSGVRKPLTDSWETWMRPCDSAPISTKAPKAWIAVCRARNNQSGFGTCNCERPRSAANSCCTHHAALNHLIGLNRSQRTRCGRCCCLLGDRGSIRLCSCHSHKCPAPVCQGPRQLVGVPAIGNIPQRQR